MASWKKQTIKVPPNPGTKNIEYVGIEIRNTEYFVSKVYAHVVVDFRGSAPSEWNCDTCSTRKQEDGYDLVEWLAQQPLCNGNVEVSSEARPNVLLEGRRW